MFYVKYQNNYELQSNLIAPWLVYVKQLYILPVAVAFYNCALIIRYFWFSN